MKFHKEVLPNGLQVIAEINPQVHSVALGFFVRTGARDESADVSGVSHFLEHMAFKGNEKYTADDVNRIFDEVGAKYNASTSEEVTLFYAAILPEYLPRTFEMLAGLIYPSLRQEDFDMEKNVILEEIGMYDDHPTFLAYEKAMQLHFADHPLGKSILGTTDSIRALSAEQMRQYHHDHYRAGNVTLAVAGNVQWETVLELAEQYCSEWPAGSIERNTQEARPIGGVNLIARPQGVQQHIMQMAPAPPADHALRYAADLLAVVVGDDTCSRLFWELIDTGYADAAELGYNEYDGSGTFLTFLSCSPDQVQENLQRIGDIYHRVNEEGISAEELEQAKNKVASRIVLRGERPMGRLSSLGSNWVYRQEYRSIEEDLATLRSVSIEEIRKLLTEYPLAQLSTAGVGPLEALA